MDAERHLNLSYIRSIAGALDRVCDRLHTLNVNWVTQIRSYVRQMFLRLVFCTIAADCEGINSLSAAYFTVSRSIRAYTEPSGYWSAGSKSAVGGSPS
jgi:hypothetical protein